MNGSTLGDAFGHHVWATLRLLDTCAGLRPGLLGAEVPGTYGPIIDTLRHLIGADSAYLTALTGGRVPAIEERGMGFSELRAAMERNGEEWVALLAQDLDHDANVVRCRDDGSESHAPMSIRLAQALHHGTDHRSQICTVLTTLGIEPPAIDVWDFAEQDGRLFETPPSS